MNKTQKAAIPAALAAVLTSAGTLALLSELEGNILKVYPDRIAGGIPTVCAGHTDWNLKPGTTFTSDQCEEVNKGTLLKYGYGILNCTTWKHLTPNRLTGLVMFTINVGIKGACGSQAVRKINAGDIQAGCRLLAYKPNGTPNWSYARGKFIQGLHNRRVKEMRLCYDA